MWINEDMIKFLESERDRVTAAYLDLAAQEHDMENSDMYDIYKLEAIRQRMRDLAIEYKVICGIKLKAQEQQDEQIAEFERCHSVASN